MINDWEQLEEYAMNLLSEDNPVRPPNSGGTKGEEDVVGTSIIIQCKFTENKNLSILKKDLDRLCLNANALLKFPIFLNSNGKDTVLSLPIESKHDIDFIKDLVKLMIIYQTSNVLEDTACIINAPNQLERYRKQETKIHNLFKSIVDKFKQKFDRISQVLDSKYKDLMMYNLFGDNNAAK